MSSIEVSKKYREILNRALTGEGGALNALVAELRPHVERQLLRYPVADEDRRDLLQTTLMQVVRRLGSFRGDAAVATWVHRIAMNEALTRVRRKGRPQTTLDVADAMHVADGADAPADAAARAARIRAVRDALARLPPDHRAAVALRDIEGYSSAEAAAILGIAEPALKSRLHRGRMRLRVLLADHREDGE